MTSQFTLWDFTSPVGETPFAQADHFRRVMTADLHASPEDLEISGKEEYRAEEEERIAAYYRNEWGYVGVMAEIQIAVPVGEKTCQMITLRSPGLWGIASDSGEDYLQTVYEEELDTLKDILAKLRVEIREG